MGEVMEEATSKRSPWCSSQDYDIMSPYCPTAQRTPAPRCSTRHQVRCFEESPTLEWSISLIEGDAAEGLGRAARRRWQSLRSWSANLISPC